MSKPAEKPTPETRTWHQGNIAEGLRKGWIKDCDVYTHGGNPNGTGKQITGADELGRWYYSAPTSRWIRRRREHNATYFDTAYIYPVAKPPGSRRSGGYVKQKTTAKMPSGYTKENEYNRCKSTFNQLALEALNQVQAESVQQPELPVEPVVPTPREVHEQTTVRIIPTEEPGTVHVSVGPEEPRQFVDLSEVVPEQNGQPTTSAAYELRQLLKEQGKDDLYARLKKEGWLRPREVVIVELEVPEGLTIDEVKQILAQSDMDVISIVPA